MPQFKVISAIHATLDTGGWLNHTGQRLSPRKAHQASLGAPTPASAAASVSLIATVTSDLTFGKVNTQKRAQAFRLHAFVGLDGKHQF